MTKFEGMINGSNGSGVTLEELHTFVEECYEKLPHNIPVKICQHDEHTTSNIADMRADNDDITFYDWI